MSNEDKERQSSGMTRRGFLGRVTLGLAAAAALATPVHNLISSESSSDNPSDNLPEDSIYRPRNDSQNNNSPNA